MHTPDIPNSSESPESLGAASPIPPRYPPAAWFPSPNVTRGRDSVSAVVVHISQGSYQSGIDWLTKPESKASAHLFISPRGEVAQLVSFQDTAWANGLSDDSGVWRNSRGKVVAPTWALLKPGMDPNRHTISVELAGFSTQARPAVQIAALVRLLQWLAEHAGLRYVVGETLIGHAHLDNVDRAFCPGPHVDLAAIARAAGQAGPPAPAAQLQVIGVPPSIRLDTFLAVCRDHGAPFEPAHFETIATRVYQLAAWLDIDPAFFLAVWLHEQGSPLGSSEVGQRTLGPFNIKAYGRWPYVAVRGVRWNAYESWQLGCLHALMHLKQFYGAKGLLHVETIIPQFAPSTDGNRPERYIAAVRRDIAAMRAREVRR